jgi:hypothetical protein
LAQTRPSGRHGDFDEVDDPVYAFEVADDRLSDLLEVIRR